MNVIKREWISYMKQTIYWLIGLALLVAVAFYKVDGLSTVPGGLKGVIDTLPPILQVFFGSATANYNTGVGMYSMIHLYLTIALLLHAVVLGSTIFTKEEIDKTFEFLYVKGMKRRTILTNKTIAGVSLLLLVNLACFLCSMISLAAMGKAVEIMDFLPYIGSLLTAQIVCFSFTLALSLLLRNNRKVGSYACGLVIVMFMLSMYIKMGGSIGILANLSLFHYLDTSYIQSNGFDIVSNLSLLVIATGLIVLAYRAHERRDLL